MREANVPNIEVQEVLIPDGFEEFYDKSSGIKKCTYFVRPRLTCLFV